MFPDVQTASFISLHSTLLFLGSLILRVKSTSTTITLYYIQDTRFLETRIVRKIYVVSYGLWNSFVRRENTRDFGSALYIDLVRVLKVTPVHDNNLGGW